MKIIGTSNFDNETVSDVLVCENVNVFYGENIVKLLNESLSDPHAPYFYKLIENDKELYKFEP